MRHILSSDYHSGKRAWLGREQNYAVSKIHAECDVKRWPPFRERAAFLYTVCDEGLRRRPSLCREVLVIKHLHEVRREEADLAIIILAFPPVAIFVND